MLVIEFDDATFPPPPQGCVAEVQNVGANDAQVDDGQRWRGASATNAREGGAENSGAVSRSRHKTIDASTTNREPGRAFNAESVGQVESMFSDGRQTTPTQPHEPTLAAFRLGKGAVEPVVNSEIGRIVTEQSNPNRCTGLGAHAVGALLPSECSSNGRGVMIDETEDDSIGVEDWLDVTHAMLESRGPCLDLE